MRWHTYEPGDPEEARERAASLAAIDAWWKSLAAKLPDVLRYFRQEQWDLEGWMRRGLDPVSPELMWEFGPGIPDGHRLVLTPEVARHLRPLVENLIRRAPKIAGWSFHAYRPAEDVAHARMTVPGRTGGAPWSATGARVTRGDANRVDVTFLVPPAAYRQDPPLAGQQAFVAAETLLGEKALDHWAGAIDAAPDDRSGIPLEAVAETFRRERDAILAGLPRQSCAARLTTAEFTMWKLHPEPADDYAQRFDLAVAIGMYPEWWHAAHSGTPFFSGRYSTTERFAYLKIDGVEGLPAGGFRDRGEIEVAVSSALEAAGIGCVIGGGTGLRYAYVDLALTDVPRAIAVLRRVLPRERIPVRSWLLFFDDDWDGEWLGIHPEAPPPPGLPGGLAA